MRSYLTVLGMILMSGTADYVIAANNNVKIDKLDNIKMSLTPFGSAVTREQTFCVHSTSDAGNYAVVVTGATNRGGQFIIPDGANGIPFQVFWSNQVNGANARELFPNKAALFSGASGKPNCSKVDNTNLRITVPSSSLVGIQKGSYNIDLKIDISYIA